MVVEVFIIDTFTSEKCKGNPTAVFVSNEPLHHDNALDLAKEYNLPVSAFIEPPQPGQNFFPIRYFTPTREIPACGHATLAVVKAVADLFMINDPAFTTKENILIKTIRQDDIIRMNYPKYELKNYSVSEELLHSLGIQTYRFAGICTELEALFIEMEDPLVLRTIQPDFKKLVESNGSITEVVVHAVSDDDNYDFILRSFCPWIGIDEDPVTGSIHSILAGYWAARLNKTNLKVYQASQPGGEVFVTAFPDKVQIGGRVTLVSVKEFTN